MEPLDVIKAMSEIKAEYLATATKRQKKIFTRYNRRADKTINKVIKTAKEETDENRFRKLARMLHNE